MFNILKKYMWVIYKYIDSSQPFCSYDVLALTRFKPLALNFSMFKVYRVLNSAIYQIKNILNRLCKERRQSTRDNINKVYSKWRLWKHGGDGFWNSKFLFAECSKFCKRVTYWYSAPSGYNWVQSTIYTEWILNNVWPSTTILTFIALFVILFPYS